MSSFSGLQPTITPSQNTNVPIFPAFLQTFQETNEGLMMPMCGTSEENPESCPKIISTNGNYYETGAGDCYWLMPNIDDIMPLFPETFGVSNQLIVPAPLPEFNYNVVCTDTINYGAANSFGGSTNCSYEENSGVSSGNNNNNNISGAEGNSSVNNGATFDHLSPINYPCTNNISWGAQSQSSSPALISFDSPKVGRYSVEERRDRILRYLKKRNQRNFNKTIKYACRKTLADRRARVRGRFARKNVEEEEESEAIINNNNNHEGSVHNGEQVVPLHPYNNNIHQIIDGETREEEWLQEAMASLMYTNNMHYVPGPAPGGQGGAMYC